MNENTKKGVLVAVIVLALVIAGFSATHFMGGDKMEAAKVIKTDPNFKSEKDRFLEGQAKGTAAPDNGASEQARDDRASGG